MKLPNGIATLACTLFMATTAVAQTALRDEPLITDGIINVGMAYELSEECDGVKARIFRGLGYLNSLKRTARDLGYSDAAINAYIDDEAEKARLEAIARARLAELGVDTEDPATYCTVARSQMRLNTRVGWLLR